VAAEKSGQTEEEKERILFFHSGGELFALDVGAVDEIVVGLDWTAVPMAPAAVVGVVNHRGEIFTVLDFARLSGVGEGREGDVAVFLHRQEMSVGVAVQSIHGIEWVPRRLMEQGAAGVEEPPGFLRGTIDFGGKVASVIDEEGLAGTIARLAESSGVESGHGE
jgi:purine-binding chemotaxis protein CheW